MTDLEIAVASLAGARVAREAGASRVELCAALELGGLTPSQGLVAAVGEAWPGRVHVLVRPRPGDFVYDEDELVTYERELRAVISTAGIAGVVIGALTPQGRPDMATLHRLAEPAREAGLVVTFHRALDQTPDPVAAFGAVAGVVDRVLTSGGRERAIDGVATIAEMASAGGPEVVAGGGVRPTDVAALAAAGVAGIHLSAKRRSGEADTLVLGVGDDGRHWVTDPELVKEAVAALRASGR